jgi:hypothetical protein
MKKKLARALNGDGEVAPALDAVADAFAHDALDQGAALLAGLLAALPAGDVAPQRQLVLRECAARLAECQAQRLEYILLALVALNLYGDPAG